MAQDLTIAGATYEDVPSIIVPKSGGGTASYVDTSDANATANDILKDKTAYVNGEKVIGTYEGGSATLITKNITENGTYNASSDNADGYSSVTVTVPSSGWASPTSFTLTSDMGYSDEWGALLSSVVPSSGQWFIGKKGYTLPTYKGQRPYNYDALGALVIFNTSGAKEAHLFRSSNNGWSFHSVSMSNHYAAKAEAGDVFYIYDISAIMTGGN